MAQHPPLPGPFVRPNLLGVMEAVGEIPFPISKRELLEQVADDTVIHDGRNVALHDMIKDIADDYFESEGEFLGALEAMYARVDEEREGQTELTPLPSDSPELSQERAGLGDASPASFVEEGDR